MKLKVVIIGGVAAGPTVAARLRRLLPDAEITIIEQGRLVSYGRCGLPFYLSGQVKDISHLYSTSYGVLRDAEYFFNEKRVKVLTRIRALSIDRRKKEISAENLDTGERIAFSYDKLVLATGARPVMPPFARTKKLKGVFFLSHPDDAQGILAEIDGANEAVVIGGGLVGMEAVDALVKRKMFVSVVELKEQILSGVLDAELATVLANRMEERGVEFYLGENVVSLEEDGEGHVSGVVTEKRKLDAQLVIIAAGVRPNTELAETAGLSIGKTGGIIVNEYLQTDDPDIYGLGDCVENYHLVSEQKVYTPLASVSNRQGRVVANNIAGEKDYFKGVLGTTIFKVLDINVGCTGLGAGRAVEAGLKVISTLAAAHDRAHYYPGSEIILLKLVTEEGSGRVLGAQGIGQGDVGKRIDVLACAINFGARVEDLSKIDLGFAPPFSMPLDLVHSIANTVLNKQKGFLKSLSPLELREKTERDEDFVLLDVRTEQQAKARPINDRRLRAIPIGELRDRLDELPREKEIITVCPLGVRSYNALRILLGAGFKNVKSLEGGLQGWPDEMD